MTQVTLRGLEPEIEREIRKEARKSGRSLNRVILDMISATAGAKGRDRARAETLRSLAGGWSEKEAEELIESIKSCEQIDEGMWK
ncbi:MAG: hypothetical protein JXL84_21985 [Deltaproteobacteria bacterium]|nr:hypothetical protein [Deltaproteobacteria bacterium]